VTGTIDRLRWRIMEAGAKVLARRHFDLRVEGREHLPSSGPVIIAARHYPHFWDGCVFMLVVGRPVHFITAVDWITNRPRRLATELGFRAVGWPRLIRSDGLVSTTRNINRQEQIGYLRRMLIESAALLAQGNVLVVFPEGHPTIDPDETPKHGDESIFLPFQPGFVHLATFGHRQSGQPIPVVPAGFVYERGAKWSITLRFGPPVMIDGPIDRAAVTLAVENAARRLSSFPERSTQPAARVGHENAPVAPVSERRGD
jgi:1-acyl-sn-glycerol-3-phosphate acyltransferase